MTPSLLVVDDDPGIREIVRRCLQGRFQVEEAGDVASGAAALRRQVPDVLIVDVVMPDGSGRELARDALDAFPDLAVVVVTGLESLEEFVTFFRLGVADYVCKPFGPAELERAVDDALRTRRLRAENARLRTEAAAEAPLDRLLGESPAMTEVKLRLSQVAATDATVLVTGESGTGKELVARVIHDLSPRGDGPFVPVHCGALAAELVESELFGHVRGAFTGAVSSRAGRFAEASGGTLFLDEIGTMTGSAQVRLLRAVQERRVSRVGESTERDVDVRLVAATNVDLSVLVSDGRFREDLFFRLSVFPVVLPALRDRPEDIPLLSGRLLRKTCRRLGRGTRTLSQQAVRRLVDHPWPGNVRELENVLERAVLLADPQDVLEPEHLVLEPAGTTGRRHWALPPHGVQLGPLLRELEDSLISQALERAGGSRAAAARLLGISRTTLLDKLARAAARGD